MPRRCAPGHRPTQNGWIRSGKATARLALLGRSPCGRVDRLRTARGCGALLAGGLRRASAEAFRPALAKATPRPSRRRWQRVRRAYARKETVDRTSRCRVGGPRLVPPFVFRDTTDII